MLWTREAIDDQGDVVANLVRQGPFPGPSGCGKVTLNLNDREVNIERKKKQSQAHNIHIHSYNFTCMLCIITQSDAIYTSWTTRELVAGCGITVSSTVRQKHRA